MQKKSASSGSAKNQPNTPPRELTDIERQSLKQAKQKVTIREGNTTKKISKEEAMIRKQEEMAMKGSAHAMHQSLMRIQRAQELQRQKADGDIESGRQFKKNLEILRQRAVENGDDPEAILPHPDDIIITDKGYRIKGPFDEESRKQFDQLRKEQEVWLYQDELEQRMRWSKYDPYGEYDELPLELQGGSALLMWSLTENCLPERMKLSSRELFDIQWAAHRMNKRELLKHLFQQWRSLGLSLRRGWVTPPQVVLRKVIDEFNCTFPRVREHTRNGDLDLANELIDKTAVNIIAICNVWLKKKK